ncbi:competence/damage-inducible protein A [Peptostreptococcus faecalis]|uniref:competence/damage-inducible protein A n=1 Tax=Peptostreptococcus faecalis TaxID=2045015 RepID=UPI000C7D2C23|nr:competence/damage-inducible protein A [Peptostreptococcus faecalis]
MNIEIISVGTELLLGDIVNTNAQFLSRELAALGVNVYNQTTVGDNLERLKESFDSAFKKSDIVITTGGLGPTTDDITKEAAAEYFDQEMVLDEKSWELIKDRIIKRTGRSDSVTANNMKQAMFPSSAEILPNNNGTAPGAIFKKGKKRIIVMPGPPREMKQMFRESVVPYLQSDNDYKIKSRYIRLYGIGESALETVLIDILNSQTNPTVALYAKEGEVLIRLTVQYENEEQGELLLNRKYDEIAEKCGKYIYLTGDESVSENATEMDRALAQLLIDRKKTISIAESCTGGLVTSSLISHTGISEVLLEGCVTYTNDSKIKRLGVKKETLDLYGAVSSQTAEEMAEGVAKTLGADIGLSTTGIAGPNGGTKEKPVGLVYIGIYYKGKVFSIKNNFVGDRRRIRNQSTREALNQVRKLLINEK